MKAVRCSGVMADRSGRPGISAAGAVEAETVAGDGPVAMVLPIPVVETAVAAACVVTGAIVGWILRGLNGTPSTTIAPIRGGS